MAQARDQELVDRFETFFRRYESEAIANLARQYPREQKSLEVDWEELFRFDPDFADDLLSSPRRFLDAAEEALRLYDLPVDVTLSDAHVRVHNLPETTEIRDIRSEHLGTLISVQGIVRKATSVKPKIEQAAFECLRCGTVTVVPQADGSFQDPYQCDGCEREGPFQFLTDATETAFIDSQKLRIQESPEGLGGGETPESIDMHVEDDITGGVSPGDHVTATGVLRLDESDIDQGESRVFDMYLEGIHVELEDEEFEEMEISDAEKEEIIRLSEREDIYEQIVDSIAPTIYGFEVAKLAIALQLFAGVTKHLPDGARIRGDIHILLVGDPGTGKCVRGDTRVTLADGTRKKIREVVESNLGDPKPVDDGVFAETDFEVLSLSPEGRIEPATATKVWKRETPAELYRVTLADGSSLEITPSHPLFTLDGARPEAIPARDLSAGTYVAVPRGLRTKTDDSLDVSYRSSRSNNAVRLDLPDQWTPGLARLLGYIVAEGYVDLREDNTAYVGITNADKAVRKDIADQFVALGLPVSERVPHTGKSANELICSSSEFASFLESLDERLLSDSASQRVPEPLFRTSAEVRGAFLRGYIEGEGHVSATQREIAVSSMSRELLSGVKSLLLSLGIRSSLEPKAGGSYRLRISGVDFDTYVREIGFVTPRKTEASARFESTPMNTNTDVLPDVGEELEHIRRSLGLSQSECGVPRTTYQHYERGDRNPGRETLRTVLSTFEERLDVLESEKRRLSTDPEWTDIERICTRLGISQSDLATELAVTQTSVSLYHRQEVVPDGGTVRDATDALEKWLDDALSVAPTVDSLKELVEGDLAWSKITDIEAVTPEEEWVYDLEVEGTHSYVSNDVVSHNSQILQYIRHISPRSVYTSGKGSSTAGLTAAAVRDDFGDGQQWSLEAGALVLADKGIAAVDELDKMAPDDRSAMHEALEQQSYHPETEILLSDGRRVEIGEFVDERMAERTDSVLDGVNCEILPVDDVGVHSTDLETNETEKVPVDRVSRHEAPEEFVRVTFSNGRAVLVTPEHPMFAESNGELTTVEARDLEAGAFVPAPRKLPNSSATVELTGEEQIGKERDVDLPAEMNGDLAEVLGLLVAEGHSYAGSSHEIGFSNQDERLLDRFDRLMRAQFGFESTDTTNAHGTVTKRWVSTKLYRWFEQNVSGVMKTAREKRIPASVLGGSEEHIRRFLVGAFAGDGGVESEAMAFSTSSRGLADDYADALAKLGVASRIHYNSAEDSWKTYVKGDSTERFVDKVVDPADERFEKATAFASRSTATPRHHDVLPPSAAREIRSIRRLLGLRLTGEFRPNLDEEYGVQVENVEDHIQRLRDRIDEVRTALGTASDLGAVRAAIGWSGRQLASRLDEETTSAVHYAESGGYDAERRSRMADDATTAARAALETAEARLAALESRLDLRYYRVTGVETVPNEGEYTTDWVYDVTVEPTNTFVSQGVILHNSISISKAGINATLKSRCALLGAANPELGRFDRYETPANQIDLEPALISRFDLIFTVTDQPDEEKDKNLARHILRTNYAGELNTQRTRVATSSITDEQVEEASRSVAPAIKPDILRKYVAFARSTCFPTMTDEAEEKIREFYVNLRGQGTGEDSPVPVTARKLEAIVRLAEASARVRLSDTVETEDAERALEIVETTLKEIGMDPETGQYDADVIETGRSKSQRDRIRSIRQLIADMESEFDEGAPIDEVLARAEELDMDREKAEHEIEKLKKQGEVYEPTTDHLRTT